VNARPAESEIAAIRLATMAGWLVVDPTEREEALRRLHELPTVQRRDLLGERPARSGDEPAEPHDADRSAPRPILTRRRREFH
jgi:hypothetical protein